MTLLMLAGGITTLTAALLIPVVAWKLADPSCPRCRHRDWSKGVPPWRCRRCGESYVAGGPAKSPLDPELSSK